MRVAPSEPLQELIGTDRRPRARGNASLLWQREPWEASLTANYTGAYKVVTHDPNLGTFSVRSHLTWDAQTAWTVDKHHKVALTIVNLFDRPPPFRRDVAEGYDSSVHDPRGRLVAVRYRYAF